MKTTKQTKPEETAPVLTPVEESKIEPKEVRHDSEALSTWNPKTGLGKKVKSGQIKSMDEILDNGYPIMESEITEVLIPDLSSDLLMIGQSKGKFGGGARRVFRSTQKKTMEGNKPSFATMAVVGNKDGLVGVGFGKSRETVPAREKAVRKAKLSVIKVPRGCGSWKCSCNTPHSIPFKVTGKSGSVVVMLMPAPKGKGLVCEKEVGKILALAGVQDVWSKIRGQAKNKVNLVNATMSALRKLASTKVSSATKAALAFHAGSKKSGPSSEVADMEAMAAESAAGPETQ